MTLTTWTDLRGRQVRSEQGTGADLVATTIRYDDADRVTSSTDPAGHASTSGYDLLGRRTTSSDPDAGPATAAYDGMGNVVSSTDAAGVTVSTAYDALDRPTTVRNGAPTTGTLLSSSSYDSTSIPNGVGRLASESVFAPAASGKTYTQQVTGYDARGQLTGKSWTFPAGTGGALIPLTFKVGYGYDTAGHRTSITYPDRVVGLDPETVTTGDDALGRPSTLTGTTTGLLGTGTVPYVSATGYAADGALAARSYANPLYPITRTYAYETDTRRLSNITTLFGDPVQPGTTAKQDDTYRWDPSGNLTSVVDSAPQNPFGPTPTATCYAYDGLDRIVHAGSTAQTGCTDGDSTLVHDGPSGFNESWTYSRDGNITSARSLLVNRTFSYTDAGHPHAVTQAGLDVFGYDAVGQQKNRLKTLGPATMTYTPEHRTATVLSGAALTRYVYAADGSRLARFNPDSTATLYLDGEEISVVLGISKGTRYTQAGTPVAQRLITGALTWQLNDTQGSAQMSVFAGTGIPIRTYYDPYGKIRDLSPSPVTDHGFLGKPADAGTALDALGSRLYDPDLGRFTSTDPLVDRTTAQTANPYAYAANNPVLFSDPAGLAADQSGPACGTPGGAPCNPSPTTAGTPTTALTTGPTTAPTPRPAVTPTPATPTPNPQPQPKPTPAAGPGWPTKLPLPVTGSRPFEPSKQDRGRPNKLPRGQGYKDKYGNTWGEDKSAHCRPALGRAASGRFAHQRRRERERHRRQGQLPQRPEDTGESEESGGDGATARSVAEGTGKGAAVVGIVGGFLYVLSQLNPLGAATA